MQIFEATAASIHVLSVCSMHLISDFASEMLNQSNQSRMESEVQFLMGLACNIRNVHHRCTADSNFLTMKILLMAVLPGPPGWYRYIEAPIYSGIYCIALRSHSKHHISNIKSPISHFNMHNSNCEIRISSFSLEYQMSRASY